MYLEDKLFEKEAAKLEATMRTWAGKMEFEKAAEIRASLQDLAALNRQIGVCAVFQNHSADKGANPPAGAVEAGRGQLMRVVRGQQEKDRCRG